MRRLGNWEARVRAKAGRAGMHALGLGEEGSLALGEEQAI